MPPGSRERLVLLGLDDPIEIIYVALENFKLVLRSVAHGYDLHERFQVLVSCSTSCEHLDHRIRVGVLDWFSGI